MKEKIEAILKKELPKFYTFVRQDRFMGSDSLCISMSTTDKQINNVSGQYTDRVSLCLHLDTLDLHPQSYGCTGGQSFYRKPNLNDPKEKYLALKNVKVPFRKVAKDETAVLSAIQRFAQRYKQLLIENKDVLPYSNLVNYDEVLF